MIESPVILACTDGSRYADSVYDHALWAARQLEGSVQVLHLIDVPHGRGIAANLSGAIGIDTRHRLKADLIALEEAQAQVAQGKAEAILEAAVAHFLASGFQRVTTEAKHGHLADTIAEDERSAALVVIGKRGEAADFERLHLGSQVERVIRSCRHPVLVASRAFQPISRVLLAYDGGHSAREAVAYALAYPLLHGTEIHLVTVGKPHAKIDEDLANTADRLKKGGYAVEVRHLSGLPEDVFAEYTISHDIDLLAMGAYGHSRIRQFIVGSTTTQMVRTCQVPVLMFR